LINAFIVLIEIQFQILTIDTPTIAEFTTYATYEIPLKISGSISHWPALNKWKNLHKFMNIIGKDRIVSVEVGKNYTLNNWSQKLIRVEDFVKEYILDRNQENIGYIAQYDIFDQIPQLLDDTRIPDYCYCFPFSETIKKNIWFGPAQTISPLHTDPHPNLFVQLVGYKYIRLYCPSETDKLYPFAKGELLDNTSRVDLDDPDAKEFPLFTKAQYTEWYL
jgi:[protein]-arginine 3-hydroxylase / protease